jgi:hypothetical protein
MSELAADAAAIGLATPGDINHLSDRHCRSAGNEIARVVPTKAGTTSEGS